MASKRPARLRIMKSAGGVVFRKIDNSIEVALIYLKKGNVFSLPKGTIDNDETPEETALREVKEETGINGRIIEKIGETSYWFYLAEENAKCKKTVHYFLMEYESGDISKHNWEVDKVYWMPIDEAIKKITFRSDREILLKAKEILCK